MPNFIDEFKKRGFLYQCTGIEDLKNLCDERTITLYIGFDCTATSLHVGNLMQVMILRLLQRMGHKPIVIIGGATSKIGDPSGKDEMRKVLSPEELELNIAGIKKSLQKFISFGTKENDALLINNNDWFESIKYIDFLKNVGRFASVNKMLTMDSVKTRLDRKQHLTFLEFNYMLLQSYDFVHLSKEYNCDVQLGGSDQWGNIIMGVDLVHKINNKKCFGLTTPLLTTASGSKMGKSADGAVWINEDKLSAYDYYQYWRNIDDRDIVKFATLYTEFNDEKMSEFVNTVSKDINLAKKELAFVLTEICHGTTKAQQAQTISIKTFEENTVDFNLPTVHIKEQSVTSGLYLYDLLVQTQIVSSKTAGKKLIMGKGISVNNIKIEDENTLVDFKMFSNNSMKLSSGKKKHIIVKIE